MKKCLVFCLTILVVAAAFGAVIPIALAVPTANSSDIDNQIESNNGTGLVLNTSANILVENNYLENPSNAWDNGNNQWNITKTNSTNIIGGPCQDGHCGSDYAGNETGCDELGDAPHNITEDTTKAYLPLAEYQKIVRAEIRDSIQDKGANWTVGITSVSELSVEEKKMLFGAEIGEIPEDAVALSSSHNVSAGTSFDWRNVNGQNWVTPVESQGSCGSCWIFGATAAFETQINIDANDPTIDFDASEQKILSCLSGGWGCNGGWPSSALSHIKAEGVPDDACFPYQANDDIPCSNKCPDWQDRAWTFGQLGYPSAHTTEGYKDLLVNHGPMVVILNVYDDFCYYTGGVYEPVWSSDGFGGSANHCVMLVGYDDNCGSNGCWIIKNSWGSGWGMSGYAYVEYGDLEKYHYALVVMDTSGPVPETQTVELLNDTVENIGWSGSYWTENGLWHITTDRSNSPTHSWWYGQEATGDYDTGSTNSGCLVSKQIDLTSAEDATLNFWTHWETEDTGTTRDKKLVDISTDAGSTWTLLKQLHSDMQGDISVSLDDYVGEEVMIRFCFDTVDAANNDYEGWFVDDATLEADVLISTMSDLSLTSKYEENVEGGFNVTYTIGNIGGCDVGESNTGIYIDGEEVFVDSVPGLSAGASYTNTVGPFDCPCGSTVYVSVCADCYGAAVETDETNNCMENEWECPKSVIEVRKTVRDLKTGEWEDVILANVSDVVRFKIWVRNSGGCCNLTDIVVNDTLSECLEYAGNATHTPAGIVNNADGTTTLYWCFTGPVGCCQDITTIEFDTYKTQPGKDRNCANVLAWCNETEPHVQIFDSDCALVHEKRDDIAIFESGTWYVDYGGNLGWDETFAFGLTPGDVPVVGDINQDGLEDTAIFRSGTWYVDTTGDYIWDYSFEFGLTPGDVPVVGDINQDGRDDTAIFRSGTWYVDTTGDHIWDETFEFGLTPGDVPVVGDINQDGREDTAIFRSGTWYVDTTGDYIWDYSFEFGLTPGDVPVVGDINHDGRDDTAIFKSGTWYVDTTGDHQWDETFEFGLTPDDVPVVGSINPAGGESDEEPDIEVNKMVWDSTVGDWVNDIKANANDEVRFKIWIHNSGTCSLTNIAVNDTLSASLEYATGNTTVNGLPCEPEEISGQCLKWYYNAGRACTNPFKNFPSGQNITIEFNATKKQTGDDTNCVNVSAWYNETDSHVQVVDEDCAGIYGWLDDVVIFRSGTWYVDTDGGYLQGTGGWAKSFTFGASPGDVPVVGDINRDGRDDVAIFRSGAWYVDITGDYQWDESFTFGASPGDVPVVGDINRDGLDDTAIFRSGTWYVDTEGNYINETGGWTESFKFGASPGDVPVVGDISGDGRDDVAIFRSGTWYVDTDGGYITGTGGWDESFTFGLSPGDVPVVGDINRDGTDDVAIFRSGTWYVDTDGGYITGTGGWDESFTFGTSPGDVPIVGDIK